MVKIILHIGAPKTGSTALQQALSASAEGLTAQGACYPEAGRRFQGKLSKTRHIGLRLALCPETMQSKLARSVGGDSAAAQLAFRDAFLAEFDAEMAACGPDATLIFSDEGLYAQSPATAAPVLRFFQGYTSEISVVVYVRRPDRLVQSAYSQLMKMGATEQFSEFLDRFLRAGARYEKLAPWINGLEPDAFALRLFPRDHPGGGDVVEDFARWSGIALVAQRGASVNQGLSLDGCALMRQVNLRFPRADETGPIDLRQTPPAYFKALQRTHAGSGIALAGDEVAKLRAAFAEDQARVLHALGLPPEVDLYRLGDMQAAPRPSAAQPAEETQRLVDALLQDPEGWGAA